MNRKKCKYKGCTNPVWSGGLCQNHIARKPLKSERRLVFHTDKTGRKAMAKTMQSQIRYDLFKLIWAKRPHKSEVSREAIYGEPSSANFHHILPKEKFPLGDLDPENIIIMTLDEHANVENDMFRYEEVNRRRELLLKKYDLI